VKRDTKSGKDKPLRMSETVTNILSEQREFLDVESDEMRSSPYVFPRRDGGQRNPDGWRKRVKEICNRAGIPQTYRPNYCLRDTIASTLLSNGATLDEVGYQLGHEPGSPMMRRYAKFIEGAQQRIVNRADELMRGKIKSDPKVIDLDEHRSKIGA
jgi:integrase